MKLAQIAAAMLSCATMVVAQPDPAWKHSYADVNGVTLHYVSAGHGPLMLFLHGFPEFWYEWKDQIKEFSKDHHVVAVDMRGYNLSSKPDDVDQYQMKYLIEDVHALAEKLGAKQFILVGHDWGGAVAWSYALQHPESLSKLVIINAPHPAVFRHLLTSDPDQQKASQYMLMFRSEGAEKLLSANNYAALVKAILSDGPVTEEDKKLYLEAWSQPGALTGGLNYYRANKVGPPAPGSPPQAWLGDAPSMRVKVPALVIWGERDTALLTSNLTGLDYYVDKLVVKRIPDATHWVVREKPELVNGYIREFIGK